MHIAIAGNIIDYGVAESFDLGATLERVLIETLPVPVTYAVKAGAVLNDATRAETLAAGLDQVAELVDTGCDAMGAPLALCSEAFRHRFEAAPLIIAKGQANYETLSGVSAPICFLLQAKCAVVADDLGVATGGVVVKASAALSGTPTST